MMSMYDTPQANPFQDAPISDPSPRSEHAYRERVADVLHTGADKARDWSMLGPDRASRPIRTAGDGLDAAAEYLETHNLSQMYGDVSAWARQNPGAALAVAAATGFCIGLALFRPEPRRVVVRTGGRRPAES